MCEKDCIGRYKYQKVWFYFDSRFVYRYIYESKLKKDTAFLNSNVTASQTTIDKKKLFGSGIPVLLGPMKPTIIFMLIRGTQVPKQKLYQKE